MAIINVPKATTFDIWRQKVNQLSENVGDLDDLVTPVTTTVVDAINSLQAQINSGPTSQQIFERRLLFKAIALN